MMAVADLVQTQVLGALLCSSRYASTAACRAATLVNTPRRMRSLTGQAINIGAVLTWGPGFFHQKLNFPGKDDPVSKPQNRLHDDLEGSGSPSSHCRHLVLLRMKGMDDPGTTKISVRASLARAGSALAPTPRGYCAEPDIPGRARPPRCIRRPAR